MKRSARLAALVAVFVITSALPIAGAGGGELTVSQILEETGQHQDIETHMHGYSPDELIDAAHAAAAVDRPAVADVIADRRDVLLLDGEDTVIDLVLAESSVVLTSARLLDGEPVRQMRITQHVSDDQHGWLSAREFDELGNASEWATIRIDLSNGYEPPEDEACATYCTSQANQGERIAGGLAFGCGVTKAIPGPVKAVCAAAGWYLPDNVEETMYADCVVNTDWFGPCHIAADHPNPMLDIRCYRETFWADPCRASNFWERLDTYANRISSVETDLWFTAPKGATVQEYEQTYDVGDMDGSYTYFREGDGWYYRAWLVTPWFAPPDSEERCVMYVNAETAVQYMQADPGWAQSGREYPGSTNIGGMGCVL